MQLKTVHESVDGLAAAIDLMEYPCAPTDRSRDAAAVPIFRTLEFKGTRKGSLCMSLIVHGALLGAILLVPLLFTNTIKIRYQTVLLVPIEPVKRPLEATPYKPSPRPKAPVAPEKPVIAPPPAKPLLARPPEVKPPEPPKPAEVMVREVAEPVKPAGVVRNSPRLMEAELVPAPPKIEVRTGMFSTASTASPTTTLPAQQIQTGGFGDPNGIPGQGRPGKIANIASLGSFDLPAGAGAGNGTAGSTGAKGIARNAGFGNGVSAAGESHGPETSGRSVRQGGFGDADNARPEAPRKRVEVTPVQTGVEILFKPKPEYSEEARQLKLEGEVIVRILFTGSGDARILNVVQGLGHGLDEAAVRAAQQIKFKPAQREGRAVDSTALVHIVFQLAY